MDILTEEPHDKKPPETTTGRLLKYHSNFYYVEMDGVQYECMVRAMLKKEGLEPFVGDWVRLDSIDRANRTARICALEPRRNMITRPKIANVDQALIVYSLKDPHFDPEQLDRYLTHVQLAGITPVVCISKMDLMKTEAEKEMIRALYVDRLGFSVLFGSLKTPDSLAAIRAQTAGKMTVLAGPSGSGKSSLLNGLNPAFRLRVGEISEKISRGQHTTRHVELLKPDPENLATLIADTPGFSNLKFNYVLPAQIEAVYPEFAPYRADCAFSDCLHVDEEQCAVQAHRAEIAESRYASYLDMIAEAREYAETVKATSQKETFGFKTLNRKGKDAVRILRLKEKDRDSARNTVKQQLRQLDTNLDESQDADDSDFD